MPKRLSFLLITLVVLALAIVLTPVSTGRQLLTLGLVAVAGGLGSWLIWEKKSKTIRADSASDLSSTPPESQIFVLGKLFEATMSGMREGLIVVDVDMRVVAANSAAHQLFTLSDGKLESQRLTELTRNPSIYNAFLDALRGQERSGIKVETHGPDHRVYDLRVVPLQGTNGKSTQGAIGVFFDVTRLELLERVRQEFLSNVSHELRTPLTAILAFVETLEVNGIREDEDSERFLSIIRRNAERMHGLIDDILELSAIEAGNVQVIPEVVHLRSVVSDVITSLAARASTRSIVLDNQVASEAKVFADVRRLEQMLTNLVDNAIKFNREGGHITVRHENSLRDRIYVEDSGEGIPAQHLPRLFERFYRIDRARSRKLGGTGLGLAIVKHLARAHGGDVAVESTLGEGSIFVIELPRGTTESD